jgi:hypothetical protein
VELHFDRSLQEQSTEASPTPSRRHPFPRFMLGHPFASERVGMPAATPAMASAGSPTEHSRSPSSPWPLLLSPPPSSEAPPAIDPVVTTPGPSQPPCSGFSPAPLLRSGHGSSCSAPSLRRDGRSSSCSAPPLRRGGRRYSADLGRLPHSALSSFLFVAFTSRRFRREEMVDSAVRKRMDQIS